MRFVLFLFTLPYSVIVGWGWLLVLFCIGAVKDFRWESTLVLTAVFRDWVVRPRMLWWSPKIDGSRIPIPLWRYSTTLGRGIAYQPDRRAPAGQPWTRIQHHEHVHVRQVEDQMFWMLIVGIGVLLTVGIGTMQWTLASVLALALWFFGGVSQAVNWITAAMRGGNAYRASEHERSAYAQTDDWGPNGESWLDRQ